MKTKTILGAGISILLANLFNKRTPLSVYLSLTDRCPFNCKYCNIPNKKKQAELTTKQIFNLMSQDDREMFGIKEPRSIGKFFHLKNGMYVKRTVKTRGYIPQVWELKPRVVEYFEQQNVKE